jgi:hypothetical protein
MTVPPSASGHWQKLSITKGYLTPEQEAMTTNRNKAAQHSRSNGVDDAPSANLALSERMACRKSAFFKCSPVLTSLVRV